MSNTSNEAMAKDEAQKYAYIRVVQKAPPIIHYMSCTLEELYAGTCKKIKIKQYLHDHHGNRQSVKVNYDYLDIERGLKTGDKYRFPKMRDIFTGTGSIPSDVLFVVEEKPHAVFKRDGNDLMVIKMITLEEALKGENTIVETPDKWVITIPIKHTYATEKGLETVIFNEGMPIYNSERRGILVVKYDISFQKDSSSTEEGKEVVDSKGCSSSSQKLV